MDYSPFFLRHIFMNANGWEIAINKEIVENCGTSDCAHKNDYLIE
jgi:hypothetical protein